MFVCGAANAGQLGLGSLQSDVPSPTLVPLPAFACDMGVGWECTIVVTHTREKSDDTGAFSTSSGSRLRGASDCSDSDLGGVDAPSPSASELSGSIVMEGPVTGKPTADVRAAVGQSLMVLIQARLYLRSQSAQWLLASQASGWVATAARVISLLGALLETSAPGLRTNDTANV